MKGYVVKVDEHPTLGIHNSYLCPHILLSEKEATETMQNYARELMKEDSFEPHEPIEKCTDFIELVNGDEDTVFLRVEELTILEPMKGE